jgi:hypothetical protein
MEKNKNLINTTRLIAYAASLTFILVATNAAAQDINPTIISNDGIAFSRKDGEQTIAYDPVAAFNQHTIAAANCAHFKVELQGVSWCFANAVNAQVFTSATTSEGNNHYIPFGGGHCALGLAFNNLAARGDPRTAVRVGDNLVLNGNFDVRSRFLTNTETNMGQASTNFQTAIAEGKLAQR